MPYYVVNARTARGAITSGTHIMQSKSPHVTGAGTSLTVGLVTGAVLDKPTLCGRTAGRYVDVFTPAEAGCRECRKRWQLAIEADRREAARVAALTPAQRQAEADKSQGDAALRRVLVTLVIIGLIAWSIYWVTHHHYAG